MIHIENLSLGYGESTVAEGVSFAAHRGEITVLVAPSGRGKTTLLKAINRLHDVEEQRFWHRGRIEVTLGGKPLEVYGLGVDLQQLRRRVAYIFQSPVVLPMSIAANVAFGLRLAGERDRQTIDRRVRAALEEVGLYDEISDRLEHSAQKLSLGQKQRLAIARALVLEPEILLLDEPTSSLDPAATRRIEDLLLRLKRDRTLLLVSHNEEQTERLGDRIVTLPPLHGK